MSRVCAATTEEGKRRSRDVRGGWGAWRQRENSSTCYGNSLTKHACCAPRIAEMTVKPQRGSALCLRLALRKYESMACGGKQNNNAYTRETKHLSSSTSSETHATSQNVTYRWCINGRGEEVGGGSWFKNGRIKERRIERGHKRGQINRCPWSSRSMEMQPMRRADIHVLLPRQLMNKTLQERMSNIIGSFYE